MPAADVIADANVALKWFHTEGEEGVEPARALLDRHRSRSVALRLLDLTAYEVGNALIPGRARATAAATATVLDALNAICPAIAPDPEDMRLAALLAYEHKLSFHDAAYAAVARRRRAPLATFDRRLLEAKLGIRPDDLLADLAERSR